MFTPVATKPHILSLHLTEGLCQHCFLLRNHLGLPVPLAPMYFHPGVLLTGSEMWNRERSGEPYLLPSAGMTLLSCKHDKSKVSPLILVRCKVWRNLGWRKWLSFTWDTALSLTRPFTLESSSLLWPTHWS